MLTMSNISIIGGNKGSLNKDALPLTFGKYCGQTPNKISGHDPAYLVWLYDKVFPKRCSIELRDLCEQSVIESKYEGDSEDETIYD